MARVTQTLLRGESPVRTAQQQAGEGGLGELSHGLLGDRTACKRQRRTYRFSRALLTASTHLRIPLSTMTLNLLLYLFATKNFQDQSLFSPVVLTLKCPQGGYLGGLSAVTFRGASR